MLANLIAVVRRVIVRSTLADVVTELETATLTPELNALIEEELADYIAANE